MENESNIWYVKHPLSLWNEDVKALARKNGLVIIDAKFDEGDGAKSTPKLTPVKKDK